MGVDVQVAALVGSELERLGLEGTGVLPQFHVPQLVREKFQLAGARGDEMAHTWENMLQQYYKTFSATEPELVADLERRMSGQYLTDNWQGNLNEYLQQEQSIVNPKMRALSNTEKEEEESLQSGEVKHKAGRVYASEILKCFVASNPAVIGGSPDVASSCGRYIHFGVREHACLAILNGISSSAPLLPYATMFTVFYQYGLPAMRMASISRFPVLYIGTHESIEVGEDGPTHQPVEVLPQLRAIPNLLVIRPATMEETVGAFRVYAGQFEGSSGARQHALAEQKDQRPV